MARISSSSSATPGNGHISTPISRNKTSETQNEDQDSVFGDEPDSPSSTESGTPPYDPSLLPHGSRSLTSISTQSFWLGFALSACIFLTAEWTLFHPHPIWRLPAFFACLSIFHFLEFYTTARFNLPVVRSSSFLIFNNGNAYSLAHTLASIEIILTSFVFPEWYREFLVYPPWSTAAGAVLILLGQVVRSVAMAQAGTNFNHTPVQKRTEGHELVTHGVYAYLRHPSYFGFFWWALGTQVLVGNKVCLVGYLFALWNFFYRRIMAEERMLVKFFGKDYEEFKKRTPTGIPLI